MISNSQSIYEPQPYEQMKRLLVKLHLLMEEGKGDDEEAEIVRDEMEVWWRELNETQRARIDGMSADLYTLGNDSPIKHPKDAPTNSTNFWERLNDRRDANDFDGVLALLREKPQHVAADRAAMLRAMSYEKLGDEDIAAMFYAHGVMLAPENDAHARMLLIKLEQFRMASAAFEWAERLMQERPNKSPQLMVLIGHWFERESFTADGDAKAELLRKAVATYEAALKRLAPSLGDFGRAQLAINAYLGLAVCHEKLGNRERSLSAIDRALRIDPKDEIALTLRAIMLYGSDRSAALETFKKAADNRTRVVWPYVFLAHDCLTHGRWDDCVNYCKLGATQTNDPDLLAELHEWMAICGSERGDPPEEIDRRFRWALQLSPENPRIAKNYDIYRAKVARPATTVDDQSFDVLFKRSQERAFASLQGGHLAHETLALN